MISNHPGRFRRRALSHLEKPVDRLVQHLQGRSQSTTCFDGSTTFGGSTCFQGSTRFDGSTGFDQKPDSDVEASSLEHDGPLRHGRREEGFRRFARFRDSHVSQRKNNGKLRGHF